MNDENEELASMKRSVKIPAALSWIACMLCAAGIFSQSCEPGTETTLSLPPSAPVYFSKNWKAEIGFPRDWGSGFLRKKSGELLAYLSTTEGLRQSTSTDNGRSWSPPRLAYPHHGAFRPIFIEERLIGKIISESALNGGQIFFSALEEESWSAPGSIRDTSWGNFGTLSFAADSLGNFYCAWIDWREGNPDVYFSSSIDGGKTWTPNVRIDDDESGQEQDVCRLLSTPEGVLHAFWQDNRNPKTLFDIYCSTSPDGGKTWKPSIKINDDTTYVWQNSPSPVVDASGNLYVAWHDYRDREVGGDITPNIYFARSEDGGKTWSANVRVSQAQFGQNSFQNLALSADGKLLCVWWNTEDNLHGDISFSYSKTGGHNWSSPARVNDDTERVRHEAPAILPDQQGNILIAWRDWREGQPAMYMAEMTAKPDSLRPARKPRNLTLAREPRPALTVEPGDTLFQDNFTDGPSPHWEVRSGTWAWKDQTYVAYGASEAQSFAGRASWDNYIFNGRFLLDPLAHHNAILYLRVANGADGRLSYYRLSHFFRSGLMLEYFDGETYTPLADAPFFFQKNTWYEFRAVIKGNVLNHFIGDSLVIVADVLKRNLKGKIGLGANQHPVYFKDIVVIVIE
jgi:hypothetical protein